MTHFGLRFTDAILFHPRLTPAARLVLAATLAYPNRNPSLGQLEEALPLRRATIIDAQNELEQAEHVRYDRPKHPWEREPASKRFNRSTRLVWVARFADYDGPQNKKAKVEVPGRIAAGLPRGRSNAALGWLLAAVYIREQLIRGAVQIDDETVAALANCSVGQVARVRQELTRSGTLAFAERRGPSFIYTVSGATAQEPNPTALDPSRTRRLLPFHAPGGSLTILGSDNQLAHASRLLHGSGCPATTFAFTLMRSVAARLDAEDASTAFPRGAYPADVLIEQLKRSQVAAGPVETETRAITDLGTLSTPARKPGLLPPTEQPLKPCDSDAASDVARFAREETGKPKTAGDEKHERVLLPRSAAALRAALPTNLVRVGTRKLEVLTKLTAQRHYGELTHEQREALDEAAAAQIRDAATRATSEGGGTAQAWVFCYLGQLSDSEELYERLKPLRRGISSATVDLLSGDVPATADGLEWLESQLSVSDY